MRQWLTAWLAAERSWLEAAGQALLAYCFVYLYGTLSLTVFAANLRAIAEHQKRDDGADAEGGAALRNLRSNALSQLVFGAYGFSEHPTHHSNPGVPHYHLRAETEAWVGREPHARPRHGYLRALYEAITLDSPSDSVSSLVRPEQPVAEPR